MEVAWLRELFPDDIKSDLHVQFDAQQKRVLAAELLRFRDLALAAKRVDPPPADAAARLLADEIMAGRLLLPNWDHHVEQWLARLNLLCQQCPELQLPAITDDDKKHIIGQLCHGAVSYKDIKEREVKPVVMSWLSEAQRQLLDKHAPERLTLPNGRTPKVNYENGKSPFISLRIQELYDVNQTPKHRPGPRAGDGSHPDAGHEAGSGDAGHGELLARALSENQIRTGAEISEAFLAMTCVWFHKRVPPGSCARGLGRRTRFAPVAFAGNILQSLLSTSLLTTGMT